MVVTVKGGKAKPKTKAKTKAKKKSSASWMMKGKDASEAMVEEDKKAAIREEEQGKLWRFFINSKDQLNEDFSITFLDGDVDEDGLLDVPMFYEHTVKYAGKWSQFTCVAQEEPCPICEGGEQATLVGVFTIIDHTEREGRDGQIYKDRKKLLVAKRTTLKLLQKMANKRDGLAGCRFDVSRSSKHDANVGDMYEFDEKITEKQLVKLYGAENSQPANYEEELTYRDADELRQMGLGNSADSVGGDAEPSDDALSAEL